MQLLIYDIHYVRETMIRLGMICFQRNKTHHTDCCTSTFLHSNSPIRGHQQDGEPRFSQYHVTKFRSATFSASYISKDG
jgi:hypothetical protein